MHKTLDGSVVGNFHVYFPHLYFTNYLMPESFDIPVTHAGKEYSFPAVLHQYGYSFKIEVDVNGVSILFEPDEERNWRAQMPPEMGSQRNAPDVSLLKAISESIDNILK